MKNWMILGAVIAVLSVTGCSATNDAAGDRPAKSDTSAGSASTPTPTPTPEVPDLVGTWKQTNTKSDDGWTAATITPETITVEFVTDGGDTRSLFWVGSFQPPADDSKYTWRSTRDQSATASALLASTDDTKDFVYDDGELSFPVSIAGTSTTVRMAKE